MMPPYLTGKDEEKDSGEEESDSSDVDDWDLPLSFDQPRHLEPIKGLERAEHSWRVKEKVRRPATFRVRAHHNKRTWTRVPHRRRSVVKCMMQGCWCYKYLC